MIIRPCHLCHLPAVVRTESGNADWPKNYEWTNSFVMPEFPERCPMLATGEGVCNSGACKSPEEAVSKWNRERGK